MLVLIPVLVARWAVAQFAAQQRAYEATVSALCQAVETKDFYTRGHSERVSRGAVMIATEIGMRPERVGAIRYAGMLHDVGKLGVPTSVLQKRSSLTDDEYAAVQLHPMRGLDIVREIGFLDEALAGIMHHHERIDGRGYPMGLAGDEIPEFARVLAVADAFDAMTSDRSYRGARPVPEAVAELRKWAGKQFDPAFVDAFVAAIERDGWTAPRGRARGRAAADHREPVTPVAGRRYEPRGLPRHRPRLGPVAAGRVRRAAADLVGRADRGHRRARRARGAGLRRADRVRRAAAAEPAGGPGGGPDRHRRAPWPTRCCCGSAATPPGRGRPRSSR